MKTARILSIDGGGIRGLIPATIIVEWEKILGPISSKFHMVAGTSTGGILSSALCNPGKPTPASALVKMYKDKGPSIFASGSFGILGEMYSPEELEKAIASVLSGKLSDVGTDLLVTSYDTDLRAPKLFKSWAARGYDSTEVPAENNFPLAGICRATSAAPTYFPPARIQNQQGKTFTFIDGGVYANNPAMCALVAARRLYPLADEYLIVSIGTGSLVQPIPYDSIKDAGLVGWARPLLDVMFQGVDATTEYQLNQMSPMVCQYRFQTALAKASEAMDDVSEGNLSALQADALQTLEAKKTMAATVIARLSQPMATRESLGYPKRGTIAMSVPEAKKKARKPFIGAAAGAAIGTAIAPGPGTAIGGFFGWLLGGDT